MANLDDLNKIEEKVKSIVCDVLGLEEHLVSASSHLKEDLEASRSETIDIFDRVIEEFSISTMEHRDFWSDLTQDDSSIVYICHAVAMQLRLENPRADKTTTERPSGEVTTPLATENEPNKVTSDLNCEICGYISTGLVDRLRRNDLERHRLSEHPASDEEPIGVSETDEDTDESATVPSLSEGKIGEDELESQEDSVEPVSPIGNQPDVDLQPSDQEIISDELPEIDQVSQGNAGDLYLESTLDETNILNPVEMVVESSEPDNEIYEQESADSLVMELSPNMQSNSNLLISPWAVFCVGIGECGTKLSATMNKKPKDFPSRHPVFYPVHCSSFDTHASISATLDGDMWKSANPMHLYPVAAPRLDPTKGSTLAELEDFYAQAGGIGGVPYFGYLAFEQLFANDMNAYSQYIEDIERAYFRTDLWNVGISQVGGAQEPQVGGAITNVGLVTFNSARGGTGSGGTPVVHRFFAERCAKYGTNLALSINVSVLPTDSEKATKPQFAKHTVGCFYRLRNLTAVHGVIIASNERLESVLGAGNYLEENSMIQEMITPLIISPSARYTNSSATASVDQSDIRRYIWNEIGDSKWPGLCTIGMAERPIKDFETDPEGAAINYERILKDMVEEASEQTTSEWESRPGKSRFIAFFIAPDAFYGRRPFVITRTIQNNILDESDLREEDSSRSQAGLTTTRRDARSMLGNVSLMNLDTATTVKLVVLYANVRIKTIDDLVEEGLGRELSSGNDGWDEIGILTKSQVEQLEIEQLSNTISRESAESIISSSGIGQPYPFQQ